MQVTKITGVRQVSASAKKAFSAEELQGEYDFYVAQKLLRSLLDHGLISVAEFDKITELNRQSFSPPLAEIMS